ncbi:cell adhesion molecule Dscam2-like [Centruroides vittatus]|uniref:cell adhesion molecule Dscam2-like n=1 Tax=Centruroides vittatus TaxID=120091 RepID=UPI0035105DBE
MYQFSWCKLQWIIFPSILIQATSFVFVNGEIKIQPFTLPKKISEGETITILCSVTKGEKPLQFQWLKNGIILNNDKKIEINTGRENSILSIADVNSKDSGNYTCVVNNRVDKSNYTAALVVEAPPKWILEPTDIDARFGDKIELNCKVSGFPTPHVVWKKVNSKFIYLFIFLLNLLFICM